MRTKGLELGKRGVDCDTIQPVYIQSNSETDQLKKKICKVTMQCSLLRP